MAVRSSFITRRRRVPLSFPLGSSEARPQALQAPLYARHRLPRPLLCSKPSSRLSKRSTNSNCSFSFVSTLMARRRTFKTCEATAATPLSWRPLSTSSARSERRRLISESSACGRPRPARLPPRAAACLRASALAGSCHQQKVCGGSTLTEHGELSRLVPRQRFISLGPLPLLVVNKPYHGVQKPPAAFAALPRVVGEALGGCAVVYEGDVPRLLPRQATLRAGAWPLPLQAPQRSPAKAHGPPYP